MDPFPSDALTAAHYHGRARRGPCATIWTVFGGASIQIARVFGIRIGADPSWFLILFLIIWQLSTSYQNQFPGEDGKAFAIATVSALLFFLSIVLHELGHALVAIRNGIGISGIDLWMFGGVATMKQDTPSAGVEFRVAAAGPLVTLLIAVACLGTLAAMGGDPGQEFSFAGDAGTSATEAVLGYVGSINVVLLVFNLIPAFPLDGGRIARAGIWAVTRDRAKATRISAAIGRWLAYAMGGLGVFFLAGGALGPVAFSTIGAVWLILIAIMLAQFARSAEAQTRVTEQLEGVRVADVMDHEPVAMPGDLKLDRALDEFFFRYGWDWFPVVDALGRFVGLVTRERAEGVPEALRPGTKASQVMAADTSSTFQVGVEDPLETLLGAEGLRKLGAVMAVDREGVLRGVVTVEQVRRALRPPAPVA